MSIYFKTHKCLCGLMLMFGLLTCAAGIAGHGGGGRGGDFNRGGDENRGGDYNRGGYDNRGRYDNRSGYRDGVYYDNGFAGPGVVVGVPDDEASSCSTVQQCNDDGNCVQTQVCN